MTGLEIEVLSSMEIGNVLTLRSITVSRIGGGFVYEFIGGNYIYVPISEFNKDKPKVKAIPKEVEIPSPKEFVEYAKGVYLNQGKDFTQYVFAIMAKYQAWDNDKWKDGNGKRITNWKTKLLNTIPHLKAMRPDQDKNQSHFVRLQNTYNQETDRSFMNKQIEP